MAERGAGLPWVYPGFLALTPEQAAAETARVALLPVPYDSTTSYRGGARDGPAAIIAASAQMEDYDPELDLDLAALGIHTAPALEPHMGGPGLMMRSGCGRRWPPTSPPAAASGCWAASIP